MNRSDSVFITVTIRDAQGKNYEMQEGDALYFAVKKKATDVNYAIAPMKLTTNVLELKSSDTAHLDFGTYVYDIKLVTKAGYQSTVVQSSQFTIVESITSIGDQ